MNLYKFRSLKPFEYVADIILNKRLFCPEYKELNDPFEGVFMMSTAGYGLKYGNSFGKASQAPQSVDNLHEKLLHTRVCSLSGSISDLRMWSHYADGHRGVAIEIEFDDRNNLPIPVKYKNSLPDDKWHFSIGMSKAMNILSTKTFHWEYESEYRIIHGNQYFNIGDKIKRIYLGTRVSNTSLQLLKKLVPPEIQLIPTLLDAKSLVVSSAKHGNNAT